MKISKSIFKAYDIRGIYKEELTEQTVKLVAESLEEFISGDYLNELKGPNLRKIKPFKNYLCRWGKTKRYRWCII